MITTSQARINQLNHQVRHGSQAARQKAVAELARIQKQARDRQ